MSNSNADLLEEFMYKAHDHGFFNKMHPKVNEILSRGKMEKTNAYHIAFQELLAEQELEDETTPKEIDNDWLLDDDSSDY